MGYSKDLSKNYDIDEQGSYHFEDGVKYSMSEVIAICNASNDALKAIHIIKAVFDGDVIPEEYKEPYYELYKFLTSKEKETHRKARQALKEAVEKSKIPKKREVSAPIQTELF